MLRELAANTHYVLRVLQVVLRHGGVATVATQKNVYIVCIWKVLIGCTYIFLARYYPEVWVLLYKCTTLH